MILDINKKNETAQAGDREMKVLRAFFPQCFNANAEFDIEAFKAALPKGDQWFQLAWKELCPYAHQYGHHNLDSSG